MKSTFGSNLNDVRSQKSAISHRSQNEDAKSQRSSISKKSKKSAASIKKSRIDEESQHFEGGDKKKDSTEVDEALLNNTLDNTKLARNTQDDIDQLETMVPASKTLKVPKRKTTLMDNEEAPQFNTGHSPVPERSNSFLGPSPSELEA